MKKVINFDGGGIRGYYTALLMQEIEFRTGKKIYELFDEFYGTSTGSILAVSFATGIFNASQIVQLYERKGKEILSDYSH